MHKFKPSYEGCTLEFLSLVNLFDNPVPPGVMKCFPVLCGLKSWIKFFHVILFVRRRVTELEPLQPLLKKFIGFLENEVLPSTLGTSRSRLKLDRVSIWLGIKSL